MPLSPPSSEQDSATPFRPFLILVPLEEEARCFLSGLGDQVPIIRKSRREVICPGLFRLLVIGMGPPDGEDQSLLSALTPGDSVFLVGFAGGLSPEASRGKAFFLSSIRDLPTEKAPVIRSRDLPDSVMMAAALGFPSGVGVHLKTIVETPREKQDLANRSGADLCDMESGPWADALLEKGVRLVVARVVSDGVDEILPGFLSDLVTKEGGVAFSKVIRLVFSPMKLLVLIRFALSQKAPRTRLAEIGRSLGLWFLNQKNREEGSSAASFRSFLVLLFFFFSIGIFPGRSYAGPVAPPASTAGPPGAGPFMPQANGESFPQLPIGVPSPFSFSTATQNTVVIPLPAIGVSYNTGVTLGTIVPILSALPSGRITSILAPSITYNPYLGTQVGARYYRYYKGNLKRWHIIGLQSNSLWNFYEFHYRDLSMGNGRYILDIRLKDFKNPASRFYGLGPNSSFGSQSNYTLAESSAHVTVGANLDHQKIRVWFMERLREYGASQGVIPGMPYSGTLFPSVNGFSNSPVIISHRVNLTYDTRDNHLIPSTGTYARVFAELDQNETPGEVSLFDRFNAEYKTWIPQGDNDQNVLAIRGMVNLMNGPNIPFYAQSMLGGAYTLEGFGTGRFYDLDAALFNMEERIQAFDMTLLGVTSTWQIAPFLGVGEVFHDQRELTNPSLYAINPGVGFRALVEPNVVGRLDMGYSTQAGVVEFVGIGFPF